MNGKQLAILLLLAVLLGGGGFVLYRQQKTSWTGSSVTDGKKLLGEFPVNDVAHIRIRQGSNELNVVRKDDLWRVRERNDYPASYAQISEFLLKLRELKAVRTERIGPSQLPKLQLAAGGQGTNAALAVEFKDQNEKTINTLLIGRKHMRKSSQPSQLGEGDEGWPDGRYVKVGADSDEVALISDPLDTVEPKPEQWLSKDFFRVEKARSIAVAFPVATNSWALDRETEAGDWKLSETKPGEQLDPVKISSVANPLSAPSFVDVWPGDKVEGSGTNAPTVVSIDTFDGFHYVVKVGAKTNDDHFVTVMVTAQIPKERTPGAAEKPEDKAKLDKEFKDKQQKLEEKSKQEQSLGKWTYLVSGWSIDSLLKERSQLLVEKKEEPNAEGTSPTNLINKILDPKLETPPLPPVTPKQ
jgi:hypothetical protein